MNLFSELGKAYDNGLKKFFRSKALMKVHIVPMKCQRKEFYAVLTEHEVKQLKLKASGEFRVIGETEKDKATWEEIQSTISHPVIKEHDEFVRYLNAERRAEKLRERMSKRIDEKKAKGEL